jgi:YfiH family protein
MSNKFLNAECNIASNIKILVTKKNFLSKENFDLSFMNKKYLEIKNNREDLNKLLPSNPYYIKQVHGNKVINLDNDSKFSHVCDGLITRKKKQVIGILTADCIPLIISSKCGNIVCALHVGRKGLEYNIIKNAFKILNKYSYEYEAWVGPAISKKYYIVDSKVKNLFKSINKDYVDFFKQSNSKNIFNMDLIGIASFQLAKNNVDNISYSNLCTVENNDDFYSHRYTSSKERFGTYVWIN